MVRQVRERLDSALTVDFSDVPILAVGSILKEFLRSLPECLFPLKYYEGLIVMSVTALIWWFRVY